jgi:hypothetical protein
MAKAFSVILVHGLGRMARPLMAEKITASTIEVPT